MLNNVGLNENLLGTSAAIDAAVLDVSLLVVIWSGYIPSILLHKYGSVISV